jgi:hypothetical protein
MTTCSATPSIVFTSIGGSVESFVRLRGFQSGAIRPTACIARICKHPRGSSPSRRNTKSGQSQIAPWTVSATSKITNYDTHNESFDFHLEQVGEFDQLFSALLDDLSQRGRLEHTLVIVMSEFGRTPKSTTSTAATTGAPPGRSRSRGRGSSQAWSWAGPMPTVQPSSTARSTRGTYFTPTCGQQPAGSHQ